MTTAVDTFRNYQEQLANLPEEHFIGDILTFQFRQPKITRDDLSQWFTDLGLDESYIPPPIKSIDAYRRATGENAKRRYSLGGQYAELMVRNVSSDSDRTIRRIIRETRDPKGKRLDYAEVGEAVFYPASRTAKRKGLGGDSVKFTMIERNLRTERDKNEVSAFITQMDTDYKFFSLHYYTQAVRDMVRNYVKSLNAISIRESGALYFVHKSRRPTLIALTELVNDRIGDGCRLHMMPLVDTGHQREMLTEAFEDEVEQSCDKLLEKVASINAKYKGKKVPPSKYAELQEACQDTLSRSDEYTRVLGLAQDRAGQALEAAMDSIADLATRLEVAS